MKNPRFLLPFASEADRIVHSVFEFIGNSWFVFAFGCFVPKHGKPATVGMSKTKIASVQARAPIAPRGEADGHVVRFPTPIPKRGELYGSGLPA